MISIDLRDRVATRFGLDITQRRDLAGLRALYAAWCRHVPFDNVRKLIALRRCVPGPLPGTDATDFLENFLQHGTGGTCWSSSNALFEMVHGCGFNARRVAGSMRDVGVPGHGSIKVLIDGVDWLVDSSMLTMYPIPIGDALHVDRHPIFGVEVEPGVGDQAGTHVVWFDSPPHENYFPCRLLFDPVDYDFYVERYEISRTTGPFNHHLSVRYNRGDARSVLQGHTRHRQTINGVESVALTRDELCNELRDVVGLSSDIIAQWVACGALDAAYEPYAGPTPAPLGTPPSRR